MKLAIAEGPSDLRGRKLSAVVFVRNYVQLQLDGPILTLVNKPIVLSNGGRWAAWEPGFRDALCAQIGKTVAKGPTVEEGDLSLSFEHGSLIRIALTTSPLATSVARGRTSARKTSMSRPSAPATASRARHTLPGDSPADCGI